MATARNWIVDPIPGLITAETNTPIPPVPPPLRDSITFHGPVTGSVINIRATIKASVQTAGGLAGADGDERARLTALLEKLDQTLAAVPEARREDAEAVAAEAAALVDKANAPQPNKSRLRAAIAALKTTAEGVKDVAAPVVAAAAEIVDLIAKIKGLG